MSRTTPLISHQLPILLIELHKKKEEEMSINKVYYLDHAGAALASPQLLQAVANSLTNSSQSSWLANPHSGHAMGQKARQLVHAARNRVLAHFGVDSNEFAVVFTANCTAVLKLLAETFAYNNINNVNADDGKIKEDEGFNCNKDSKRKKKFISNDLNSLLQGKSTLLMLNDSHTSVLGMRQLGSVDQIVVTDFDELNAFLSRQLANDSNNQKISRTENGSQNESEKRDINSLFVMTAMSNFCGRIYDLKLAERLKSALGSHWKICFDVAALAPYSTDIGLCSRSCDFAAISFYKMFGYPTGLGALLIRRDCAHLLQKRYFGGGTVAFASAHSLDVHFRDDIAERFEDGTPNIYAISALLLAFEQERVIINNCALRPSYNHSMHLAEQAFDLLTGLRHGNGRPLAVVYGRGWRQHKNKSKSDAPVQGPIVNFNLLRDDGSFVGFVEIDRMADLFGIQLRTGCHCNLGACQMHLGLSEEKMRQYFQMGKVCGDDVDLVDGLPLGSVRISFGRSSNEEDLLVFQQMLECCFLHNDGQQGIGNGNGHLLLPHNLSLPSPIGHLSHLFVYPVKSCAAIRKERWPICPHTGTLLFDRRWMVVFSATGEWLSQKRYPALCSIVPQLNFSDGKAIELILNDRHKMLKPLSLPLSSNEFDKDESTNKQKNNGKIVCFNGMEHLVNFGGLATTEWMGKLDQSLADCKLVASDQQQQKNGGFANRADFLLITRASVEHLASRLALDAETIIERFRPNFVVDFGPGWEPFREEHIKRLSIGSLQFRVVAVCRRCQMICIDQETGQKDPNVLIGLRDIRLGHKGSLVFGIYLELLLLGVGGRHDGDEKEEKDKKQIIGFVGQREVHTGCTVRVLEWTVGDKTI